MKSLWMDYVRVCILQRTSIVSPQQSHAFNNKDSDMRKVLDMDSRSRSDLDIAKAAAGDLSPNEDGGDDDGDTAMKPNLPARKRKKVTPRGFFQLADTVESAKWDDEAWRRDFNVSIVSPS